jgi:acyl-coenzyme A thioesterase PaaI-like protein
MRIPTCEPQFRYLFDFADKHYIPTSLTVSPWDRDSLNGLAINALVAHLAEKAETPAPMVISRLVTDILKPTRMAPVSTRVEVVREGKKLQLMQVELLQDGVPTVRTSALRVRIGESPTTPFPVHKLAPEGLPPLSSGRSGIGPIAETRLEAGGLELIGPGLVWSKMNGDIVPGTAISPFVHAAMAADYGSGTSSYVDWRQWSYANVDISLHLTRMPEGPWLRVYAVTESAGNGTAVVDTRLSDERGEFAHAHQTLFIDRAN